MVEPVKASGAITVISLFDPPERSEFPRAGRTATVNHPDIRGLRLRRDAEPHDWNPSGAASIYSRGSIGSRPPTAAWGQRGFSRPLPRPRKFTPLTIVSSS